MGTGGKEPKEAAVAVLEEAAVAQAEAFVAAGGLKKGASTDARDAKPGWRQGKGKGGDHVRGKEGYGHCIAHQFFVGWCKNKVNCHYWHVPNQEGCFVHVKCPETGRAPCPKFAKTGACGDKECKLAHIKEEEAKPKHYTHRGLRVRLGLI